MQDSELLREVLDTRVKPVGTMHLGSWVLRVSATRPHYVELLNLLFRQRIGASPPVEPKSVDVDLRLVSCDRDDHAFTFGRSLEEGGAACWESVGEGAMSLMTGRIRVVLDRARRPMPMVFLIREPQFSERALRDHLFEVICKVLFAFDRFYVHAGAVALRDRVNVFVGQGSFGKSTTCLRLAKEGAIILSEDHVLFRREGDVFSLSGCQETARVTAKTESYLFDRPLPGRRELHTGVAKKEIRVADYFASRPYVNFPFHRIFFNHVGTHFSLSEITEQDAMLRLLRMTRSFFRFSEAADLERYLDYFAALVVRRECFDLQLAPDLDQLDRLVDFLAERDSAAR